MHAKSRWTRPAIRSVHRLLSRLIYYRLTAHRARRQREGVSNPKLATSQIAVVAGVDIIANVPAELKKQTMTTPSFDITPFLERDEGQHFERKSLFEGPERTKSRNRRAVRDDVAENVAAFANAEGGILILGIEDDDLTVTGHKLPKRAVDDILATPRNRLIPPQPEGFVVTVGDRELIVFDVPMEDVPVRVDGDGFPLRIGDQTVQSSESHINALKREGVVSGWERRQSSAALADLDAKLLELARQNAGLSKLTDEEYLIKRKLAYRRGRNLVLSNAAELLFASEDPDHPNAGVRLFRVIGTERHTGARYNVEERPRSEGNLPSVIAEVGDVINGMLRRPSRLVGNRFQETPEYPDFAWREALLNAIAHRDYGIDGIGTEVHLFDDRMEVTSPGSLVGDLTLEQLLQLERVHRSRNPRIIRVLVDLGLARDQGEGIPRMFAEMADAFLPPPAITATHLGVKVTLRNTLTLNPMDHDFLSGLGGLQLDNTEIRALLYAHRNDSIDNAGLRSLSGLDTLNASRLLRGLCDKNLLELHPHGSNSYYTLTSSPMTPGGTEVVELDPVTGELRPGVVELDPVTGELRPGVGELDPVTGELRPEVVEPAPVTGELRPGVGELDPVTGELRPGVGELDPVTGELRPEVEELPIRIQERIAQLGLRAPRERVQAAIQDICSQGIWVTSSEISQYLSRQQGNLTWNYLSPMVESGLLERRFPENVTHPQQAYRSVTSQLTLPLG